MIKSNLRQLLWLIIVVSLLRPAPLAAFEADRHAAVCQPATARYEEMSSAVGRKRGAGSPHLRR